MNYEPLDLSRSLEAIRKFKTTCVEAMRAALEKQLLLAEPDERAKTALLLEPQLRAALADQQRWQRLTGHDIDWDEAGDFIEGRTAIGRDVVGTESRLAAMLLAIAWTDEYQQARVCLRHGNWEKAAQLIAAAQIRATDINYAGVGDVPLWFAWQRECRNPP